jgi:hypothetical protein
MATRWEIRRGALITFTRPDDAESLSSWAAGGSAAEPLGLYQDPQAHRGPRQPLQRVTSQVNSETVGV